MSTILNIQRQDIQTLFSEKEIAGEIQKVAKQIDLDYKDSEGLVIVGVLKGALMFTADLIRAMNIDCQLEFIRLSSYEGTSSSGTLRVYDLSLPNIINKDILIVEDIVDSGRTAKFLLNFFENQAEAKSIKMAALLNKPCRRIEECEQIVPDYTCFTIDDKFVVGYGLDYEQKFRDLPFIGFIETEE